jgi:hypothetical protein
MVAIFGNYKSRLGITFRKRRSQETGWRAARGNLLRQFGIAPQLRRTIHLTRRTPRYLNHISWVSVTLPNQGLPSYLERSNLNEFDLVCHFMVSNRCREARCSHNQSRNEKILSADVKFKHLLRWTINTFSSYFRSQKRQKSSGRFSSVLTTISGPNYSMG